MLCTFHPLRVTCVFGGTSMNTDKSSLRKNPDILVATVGRLLDHLQNTTGFSDQVQALQVLVLDEADQLLEMVFQPDIKRIISYLPQQRQSLLFSATVPDSVHKVAHLAMRPGFNFINTVPAGEDNTHLHVKQEAFVVELQDQLTALTNIIAKHQSEDPNYKVIVFFTTARLTGYLAEMFQRSGALGRILEIHSRKSQSFRTKASDSFRKGSGLVLFTSDVSARGVDY